MKQPLAREEEGLVIAGRYTLTARLGRGASSRVYEAWDTLERRAVAVKLIRPYATEDKQRIEREIAALRILRLPSVAGLLDTGSDDGETFLALELIPGLPFPGAPCPIAWENLVPLAERLFATLARVHAAGIVHRDVKPANVLVTDDGNLGLLDFGLAWGSSLGSGLTQDFVGTVRYAAPEQFLRSRVDARADLYAVGVMLFEALAGRPPWTDADVLRLAGSRASTEPPPLRSFCPNVPTYACTLVDSLLRRLPEERPRSASEALLMLRATPDAAAQMHRLPWLGSTHSIDMIEAVVISGRSIDVSGPSGSGCSRLLREVAQRLEARGRRSAWVTPGRSTFESLALLAPLPTTGSDGYAMMEANLLASLGPDTVLLVDDLVRVDSSSRRLLERIRGRRPIVRVVPNSGDIRLGPLSATALQQLFCGPDRVLHLREDGAREMLARTGGLAGNVAVEAVAWVAGGVATWSNGRLRVARDGLDRLAVGLRTTALPRSGDGRTSNLEPQLRSLLGWAVFADEHASVDLLAKVTGEQPWAVSMELEHLVELGHLTVEPNGAIRVLNDAGVLAEWSDERTIAAHARLAASLPSGASGRLAHLLAAKDLGGAQEECEHVASELAMVGASSRAMAVLQIGLGLARQRGADDGSILHEMVTLAFDIDSMRVLEQVAYELRRGRDAVELRQARTLLSCWEASVQGDLGRARAIAQGIGPMQDPDWEQFRAAVLVRAAMALSPDLVEATLTQLRPGANDPPGFLVRWHTWNGHWQRSRGNFREAAELHMRALALPGGARARHLHLFNAALCALDGFEMDDARRYATECIEAARAAYNPAVELRALVLLRDIGYRTRAITEPDLDLVEAAEVIAVSSDHSVYFHESLIAARAGNDALAVTLADRCRAVGVRRGVLHARVAGEVLIRLHGGDQDWSDSELHNAIRRLPQARLEMQFLTMFALSLPPSDAAQHLPRIEILADGCPEAYRDFPLEVYSATECRTLIRQHVRG